MKSLPLPSNSFQLCPFPLMTSKLSKNKNSGPRLSSTRNCISNLILNSNSMISSIPPHLSSAKHYLHSCQNLAHLITFSIKEPISLKEMQKKEKRKNFSLRGSMTNGFTRRLSPKIDPIIKLISSLYQSTENLSKQTSYLNSCHPQPNPTSSQS